MQFITFMKINRVNSFDGMKACLSSLFTVHQRVPNAIVLVPEVKHASHAVEEIVEQGKEAEIVSTIPSNAKIDSIAELLFYGRGD